MEIAVMIVARTLSRNTRMTSTAKPRPRRPSTSRSSIDCSMKGAWSKRVTNSTSSPSVASTSCSASSTPCDTSTVLPSGVLRTCSMSESSPFVRETELAGASTRSTSATSLTATGPSAPATMRSRICSTEVSLLPTSTGAAPLSVSSWPGEEGTPFACSSPASVSMETPSSSRSSSRTVISTWRGFCPVTTTLRTPSTSLSSGTATSSRSAARSFTSPGLLTESMTIGKSARPPAMTDGSTPSGSEDSTWDTARCRDRTTSSESVP